jgi:hypothetical protein
MQPNTPTATPSQMLPSNLLRGGQNTAGQIFQQNPLATGMSPSAMGGDPSLQTPPPAGSQAVNQSTPPMAGTGQPQNGQPPISEAQYILEALADRLAHHSKITEKTVSTLAQMIQSQVPTPGEPGMPTA